MTAELTVEEQLGFAIHALVDVVGGVEEALEAHHRDDVGDARDCPICTAWQPKVFAAYEQAHAALSALVDDEGRR